MSIHRGEVWLVRLDPAEGHEQAKTRPCVVISNDSVNTILGLSTVVPFTGKGVYLLRGQLSPLMVEVLATDGGLKKNSYSLAHQVRSVSHTRFDKKLGVLSNANVTAIVRSVQELIER